MRLETLALFVAIAFGVIWLALFVSGLMTALPFGILGLVPVAIVVTALAVVIYQRLNNKEDDYYDKNVDK